ncbi:MAG: Ig-like domain-containing protein [Candidatus Riflebacteria bacterium]|nr:Ig-like domain-containing protein [Candidatus Riflebacteria bacterium]
MNRWKRAAILCTIAVAISHSSPLAAALNRNSVTTETAAIGVAKHFPTDMAVGVSPETPLTVEFGGAVNQSFYQTVNFNLFKGTEPIGGELFYNPSARQVMFKSNQNLQPGQTYTAQLSYYDGLGRTSEKVWSFQTAGNNNQPENTSSASLSNTDTPTQAGSLVLTNANMGSGSIGADMPMEVSFSEAVDIVSLKAAPIQLFEDNRPIGVDYKLSRDMKTITVSPRVALKPGSAYAISVEKSLAATSGSRLRQKTLIPFKLAGSNDEPRVERHIIEETPAPESSSTQEYASPYASQRTAAISRPAAQNTQIAAQTQMAARNEPVQIVGLAPQNGSRVSNLTQPVTIAFSDEIMADSLNEFTFRLEDDFGPVPARIHYFKGHKQATLTPVGLLDGNKNYRVVITQGVTDAQGKPIRSGINSMFSTASPVAAPETPTMMAQAPTMRAPQRDTAELETFENNYDRQSNNNAAAYNEAQLANQRTAARQQQRQFVSQPGAQVINTTGAQAPADRTVRTRPAQTAAANNLKAFKVTSIYPGANSNNVSRRSKIAVHFSEAADPKTVNNINISIFGNQVRVDGNVTYDRQNKRAIFEPTRQLDSKTEYKVIVSDKIKSQMGEPLAQRFAWDFATNDAVKQNYLPGRKAAEADAAFFIPLVDSRIKRTQGQAAAVASAQKSMTSNSGSFTFVSSKHWAFKSMRHVSNKGILNAFPFVYTDSVTRYEFASAINNALNNLKSMQHAPNKPRLRVNDMIQLEQLVIEFRNELKSYNVNTIWFETFLQQQGVNLQQIEARVNKLNGAG